jgi:hypothetical protein
MGSGVVSDLVKLEKFMCGLPVKKLPELFDSVFDGVVVVPVWFDSVVEGVDMWFKEDQLSMTPRYLLIRFFSLIFLECGCFFPPNFNVQLYY